MSMRKHRKNPYKSNRRDEPTLKGRTQYYEIVQKGQKQGEWRAKKSTEQGYSCYYGHAGPCAGTLSVWIVAQGESTAWTSPYTSWPQTSPTPRASSPQLPPLAPFLHRYVPSLQILPQETGFSNTKGYSPTATPSINALAGAATGSPPTTGSRIKTLHPPTKARQPHRKIHP